MEVPFGICARLKGPQNWTFGSDEDFEMAALICREDSCQEWEVYRAEVQEWLDGHLDLGSTSPVVGYHVAKALKEVLEGALHEVQTYQLERDNLGVSQKKQSKSRQIKIH
jgi:hypothetical protein